MQQPKVRESRREEMFDYMAKVIIIGDSGVGKTNLLSRFCEDVFKTNHVATIGVDFNVKTLNIEGKRFRMQIWDTAGQERFKTITESYYRGATGIIVVFALNSEESFQSIPRWLGELTIKVPSSVQKILVGNKLDSHRVITQQQGKAMAAQYGLSTYLEVSAKSGVGVEDAFRSVATSIKHKFEKEETTMTKTMKIQNKKKLLQKNL